MSKNGNKGMGNTSKGLVGLGTVIIILLAAVLFFQGIHFSTSTVNNFSTSFLTTEGVFHTWSMVFNITDQASQVVYITDVAVVEQLSSNVTFVSLTTGLRLASYQLTYPTGSFDPTSTINAVYNVYLNSTNQQMVILGHDGSIIQRTTLASGSCNVQQAVISTMGQYIATKTSCPGFDKLQVWKGA